jgi:hypothetical protein
MKTILNIPTDNLHKFKAIFGIVLLTLSFLLLFWGFEQNIAHNLNYGLKVKQLESELIGKTAENYTSEDWFKFMQLELNDKVNKGYYFMFGWQAKISVFILIVGAHQLYFGFRKWRKVIQPLHDELLKLEVEKLRLECKKLEKGSGSLN